MIHIPQLVSYINTEIERILSEIPADPKSIYSPIGYILNLGGKRIRPMLTLLSCFLFDDNFKKAIYSALAAELFHNFTLVHDDIMDEAPLRRNSPTIHMKWNINEAILSGDAMLIKSYQLLSLMTSSYLKVIIEQFNACGLAVCEGQQLDMQLEKEDHVSEQQYLEMIKLKTGMLLGFCMESGALIGGSTPEEASLLKKFGIYIGMGFQLKDDFLDVYSKKKLFGKQMGGDIIANKKTFLLIKALEKAQGETKQTLVRWLSKKEFDKKEKVKSIKVIYDGLNIKAEIEKNMFQYFERALSILDMLSIPKEKKALLSNFIQNLIKRDH